MIIRILLICLFISFFVCCCANGQSQNVGQPRVNYRRRLRGRANQTVDAENLTKSGDFVDDTEDSNANSVMEMLHKINDRLTSLSTVSDQQMRRLETIEYRITKLEVQIQEKNEGIKTDVKEVARQVRQIDWQSSKTESALDALKSDTSFLKQALEHFRVSPVQQETNVGVGSEMKLDISNKVQMVLRSVQTLLNSVSMLQNDFAALRSNVTNIANSSSYMTTTLPQLLTSKHFQRSFLDIQHRHQSCANSASVHTTSNTNTIIEQLPRDCSEVHGNKSTKSSSSGIYRIQPPFASAPFFVYCDLETNGGGWTVIQRRTEGNLDFYKGWHDYKQGFGNIGGEFWLGLEKIHLLTNYKVNEIYIELEDFALVKTYAHYTSFALGNEVEGYPISFLGSYDGTAGDSLLYHAGQKFSTFDMDHDNWPEGNCAQSHSGAWWYNGCDTSNLNGRYLNGELPDQYEYQGMYWYEWRGPKYSLKSSKIMIRTASSSNVPVKTQTELPYDEDYAAAIFNQDD